MIELNAKTASGIIIAVILSGVAIPAVSQRPVIEYQFQSCPPSLHEDVDDTKEIHLKYKNSGQNDAFVKLLVTGKHINFSKENLIENPTEERFKSITNTSYGINTVLDHSEYYHDESVVFEIQEEQNFTIRFTVKRRIDFSLSGIQSLILEKRGYVPTTCSYTLKDGEYQLT